MKAFIILSTERCTQEVPQERSLWTNIDVARPVAMGLSLFSPGKHIAWGFLFFAS